MADPYKDEKTHTQAEEIGRLRAEVESLSMALSYEREGNRFCQVCTDHDEQPESDHRVAAALKIHAPRATGFLTGECAGEDPECEHDGRCPKTPMTVCAGCWEFAETVHPYFTDRPVPDEVMWPCATATALGTAVSLPPAEEVGTDG